MGHDHIRTAFDRTRLELALRHERLSELIEIAVKPPMTPRQDLVYGSMAVAARINPRSLDRANVEVHVDRLLRQMDRRARLKAHTDHQEERELQRNGDAAADDRCLGVPECPRRQEALYDQLIGAVGRHGKERPAN